MNFFKLYIGDYQRDTAHLSISEHGAFLLMLQHYYATEKPLPTGKALYRMLRADGQGDKEAIDVIVKQFWTETEGGLINERAHEELTKAGTQADTNRRIAVEREARRRPQRTQHEPSHEPRDESLHASSEERATNGQPIHSQTPDTRARSQSQTPDPDARGRAAPDVARETFLACQAKYPAGLHRGDHWLLAQREIGFRLDEGHPSQQLIDNTIAFQMQQEAEGNIGTGKVMRPNNFYSSLAWLGPFPLPVKRSRSMSSSDRSTWAPEEQT